MEPQTAPASLSHSSFAPADMLPIVFLYFRCHYVPGSSGICCMSISPLGFIPQPCFMFQSHISHSLQSAIPCPSAALLPSFPISQPLSLFPEGLSLWRARHLSGLLLGLPFGVAGIAVPSWSCWRIKGAGGGVQWVSCPWTPQPWTSTLTLTESLPSAHPPAVTLLSLSV